MFAQALLAALLAVPVAGGPPAGVQAAAPAGVTLNIEGNCPDPAEVSRLLGQLLAPDEGKGAALTIVDRGTNYRLTVRGEADTLDDPARDCAARARQAAIIAARELRSAHREILGPPLWTVEKGFTFELASGPASTTLYAIGAEIRGALGSGTLSLFGAAGARGPATSSLERGWKVEMIRFPLDVGVRATLHGRRLRPWVGVGPSLTPTAFLGQELVHEDRQWRVDPGALAMVGATLPITRLGLAAALTARWQPRQYHLEVDPFGTIAETPAWWFGLSANYVVDSKRTSP